ncbi:NAD-dependent protein deacetylase of SIR2 family [hydrothermal vent metagenome]|uniref:NAD-dependent protein deacetylase of SIR2 family n=1 Tax=hydrothermal vent metagenome TaxID=652676 RepID=A0A160TUP3_9ZZZZ
MAEVLVRLKASEKDPDCPSCGGILKSATISFGQSLVPEDLARAEQAVRRRDLLLAIGSSLSVYPVAGLVPLARDCGAKIIIINATPTDMDPIADVVLLGNISDVLPALF